MASWMIHLRVADALLSRLDDICETEFVVGNIAPDSGIPNADWSEYSPSSTVSHFKEHGEDGHKKISIRKFIDSYFTKEMRESYTKEQCSFFLGYLSHLLTDALWVKKVFPICASKSPEEYSADPKGLVWKWKKDFFDLDALYIRKHPELRSYAIYENAVGFENKYMDIFPPEAFDERRRYICSFYRAERDDLFREYFYFTEKEADEFVSHAAETIEKSLRQYVEQ